MTTYLTRSKEQILSEALKQQRTSGINPSHNFCLSQYKNKFVVNIECLDLFDSRMRAFQVSCSYQSYDEILYSVYNIQFPPKLAKSSTKRKADFLAGRISAKLALQSLGINKSWVRYDQKGCPVFPKNVIGSISHSNQIAIALAAPSFLGASLGVDLEKLLSANAMKAVKRRVFKDTEIKILINAGLTEKIAATLIFSAKESIFKAIFPLISQYFDFDKAFLIDLELGENRLTFQLDHNFKPFHNIPPSIDVFFALTKDKVITHTITGVESRGAPVVFE